jgi:hypothetical protein
MNLFRSEEHARNWSGFEPDLAARMLKPFEAWAEIFANPIFRQRVRPDYISWLGTDEARNAFGRLRSQLAG